MLFSIPGCILGMIAGYFVNYYFMMKMSKLANVEYDREASVLIVVFVLIVGVIVPLIVSLFFSLQVFFFFFFY
jgi:hypothetical protein